VPAGPITTFTFMIRSRWADRSREHSLEEGWLFLPSARQEQCCRHLWARGDRAVRLSELVALPVELGQSRGKELVLCAQLLRWVTARTVLFSVTLAVLVGYQETFLHCKSGQALDQAAQGGGGVPIPGGVQKPCGCGTLGHGLAGMGVLG